MLDINCLLKNTQIIDDIKDVMQYLAYDKASRGEDVKFPALYNEMTKKLGIEIDLRSAGHLYGEYLPTHEFGFTSKEDIEKIANYKFESTLKNVMLMPPKEGIEKTGRQSVDEHVATSLVNGLYNEHVENNIGKSKMKEIQDALQKGFEALLPEPIKKTGNEEQDYINTIKEALRIQDEGFRGLDGKMNTIRNAFSGAKEYLEKYSKEVRKSDNPHLVEQYNNYLKDIEQAEYSLMFSRKETKNIVSEVLKGAGYEKTLADGTTILDFNKIARNMGDADYFTKTIETVMENRGFGKENAKQIAESLKKEYQSLRATEAQKEFQKTTKKEKPVQNYIDTVKKALEKEHAGHVNKKGELILSDKEAKGLVIHALKEAGYEKTLVGGKKVTDWEKLSRDINSPEKLYDTVKKTLEDKGITPESATKVAESLKKEYVEMRDKIKEKANDILDARTEALNKPAVVSKTDFEKLIQLNDLGIFNRTHDELLYKTLGVSDLDKQDIQALQKISNTSRDLSIELDGQKYLASSLFQDLERQVNEIIGRNVNDKTRLTKIMAALEKTTQLINFGRISGVYNLTENSVSGVKEVLAANLNAIQQRGIKELFKDTPLFWAVLKDVASGGVDYGHGEHSKFAPHDFVDKNFRDTSIEQMKKHPGKWLGAVILKVPRVMLNGMDSAYKAVLHRKLIQISLYKGLRDHGYSHEKAVHYLHEALYGENLEKAKEKAKTFLEKYSKNKITDAAVTRLANDMVIANLNNGGVIDNHTIEAAYNSGYHVAAIGLGHQVQERNFIGNSIQDMKSGAAQRVARYQKEGNWGKYAIHKGLNTVWFNGMIPFIGGRFNWVHLTLQSDTPLGIVTGYASKSKWNKKIDFESKETLQQTMSDYADGRQKIFRSISGQILSSILLAATYGAGSLIKKDDEDEGNFHAIGRKMADSYVVNKAFNKVAPLYNSLIYAISSQKNPTTALLKVADQKFNIGDSHSLEATAIQSKMDAMHGMEGKSHGEWGSFLGSKFEIPLWRSYLGGYQALKWGITGKEPEMTYHDNYNFFQGLLGGGIRDELGLLPRTDTKIGEMPGMSAKAAAQLRAMGVETVKDLDAVPNWEYYIDNSRSRERAKEAYYEMQ